MNLLNKKDIILVLGILLLAGVLFVVITILKQDGAEAVIKVNGTIYGTYQLAKNQTIRVDTTYGHNTLIIQDGKIYMEDADCPDKYCISQGKINQSNQTIVCLPHRLVVEITADYTNNRDVDAVVR